MNMKTIVTTGRKKQGKISEKASKAAEELGGMLVARGELSMEELREKYQTQAILVAHQEGFVIDQAEGEFFFHPSMARLRMLNLQRGLPDHMTDAMGLRPGMQVLDCTMGFGADALVAAFVTGGSGQVTGLEINPLVAFVVRQGLAEFLPGLKKDGFLVAPIGVVQTEYEAYLQTQADKSADIVYFDPMFRIPLKASSSMQPLRGLADMRPVALSAIEEARRVARKRIVIKEVSGSPEFARLGCTQLHGGKYSKVQYGIIEIK